MKTILIIYLLLLSSFSVYAKTVILLGQHHLTSKVKTNDIEKSKALPQYLNQKTIYLILNEWVSTGKLDTIISEGCEGEIDEGFKLNFNGWDFNSLKSSSDKKFYPDILTLIPLKVEAKYQDKVKTLCGDSYQLMQNHLKVFNELNDYLEIYTNIKSAQKGSKNYLLYKKTLEKREEREIANPVRYAKKKAIKLLQAEKSFITKRNDSFLKVIYASKAEMIAVVIGERHIKDLKARLEKNGHKIQLVDLVQETLPKVELYQQLIDSL